MGTGGSGQLGVSLYEVGGIYFGAPLRDGGFKTDQVFEFEIDRLINKLGAPIVPATLNRLVPTFSGHLSLAWTKFWPDLRLGRIMDYLFIHKLFKIPSIREWKKRFRLHFA